MVHTLRQARTEIVMGDNNRSRGYGTVRFDSHTDAAATIEVSALDAVAPSVLYVPHFLNWRPVVN